MAIKRISDLDSILLSEVDGRKKIISINEGIKRDVLGGYKSRREGGEETQQLIGSKLEFSWLKDGDQNYTQYESRSVDYDTLCAYITHNIQCEDYDFYGNKTISGNIDITGNVNVQGDKFSVYSTDITLSGQNVNVSGDTVHIDGRETYIYGHDFINISVITEPGQPEPIIGLSGDNIALNGRKSLDLIYDNELRICLKSGDSIIPVMTFGHVGSTPTVKLHTESGIGTESNPMYGTVEKARWA